MTTTVQGALVKAMQCIWVFFLPIIWLYGQNAPIKFEHLTVEDGLSEGSVYAILEDSQGFMWFGTRFGLNRYDGHEFKIFPHDAADSTSLPGFRIMALLEDHNGNIWVGTESNGLGRYDRKSERFTHFHHEQKKSPSLSSDLITCLFEDSQAALWIGTKDGLNRWNPDESSFQIFRNIPGDSLSLNDNFISALSELPDRVLLVGLGNGSLSKLNLVSGEISHDRTGYFEPSKSSDRSIKSIIRDRESDAVWLTRFGYGITRYDLRSGVIEQHSMPGRGELAQATRFIWAMSQDTRGRIWMGTIQGVTVFDPGDGSFTLNLPNPKDPFSVSDHLNYSIYVDRQGTIWAGSEAKGVDIHKPGQIRFELFQHDPENPQSPSANSVLSLAEDSKGRIWFTTLGGGPNRYDPVTGVFEKYKTIDQSPKGWSVRYAQAVLVDHLGMAWIGTGAAGVMELEPETGQRTRLCHPWTLDETSLSGHTVNCLLETRDGSIWVGTKENGLNRYDRETDKFTRFKHDAHDPTSIGGNAVRALFEDHSGVLWVGSEEGGLDRFMPGSQTFAPFKIPGVSGPQIGTNVTDIHEDDLGNLWIGTRGSGLFKLDATRTQLTTLKLLPNPLSTSVGSIEQDAQGFLWLGTNLGLIKADTATGFLNRYTRSDGLQGDEFYPGASLQDSQGFLYFGGPHGFNRFHPDSLRNNAHIPPVVITSLTVNYHEVPIGKLPDGRTLLTQSISATDKIILKHSDRVVTFKYAALDFADPARIQYAYMLEGFDKDWVYVGNQHSVSYTQVNPGTYIFRIKASNNDGLWNEEGRAITLIIRPPFWKTWWFTLLTSLSLVAFVLLYVRLRISWMILQRKKLEALVKERTQQLKVEIEERQILEREKSNLRIDHLKRELLTQSLYLNDKQKMLDEIQTDVELFNHLPSAEIGVQTARLIRKLKARSSAQDGWQEFERWFTEIHTGFFSGLRNTCPALSESELKVCALLRVKMISKDIAKVMNVQPSSIDIYRHRIRKKLGLAMEDNLTTYLSGF